MTGEHAESDRKIETLIGAYLIVAASDGVIAGSELTRFHEQMAEILPSLGLTTSQLGHRLELALARFRDRPGKSRDDALAAIASFRDDEAMAAAISRLARIAAVADRELEPQEEYALREIADMLGLSPEDF